MKMANRSFENLVQFKYLWATVRRHDNLNEGRIKRKFNHGTAGYSSVHSLLSSYMLFTNINIRMYKTIILLVVLLECETLVSDIE
jgi:hypothetical protein